MAKYVFIWSLVCLMCSAIGGLSQKRDTSLAGEFTDTLPKFPATDTTVLDTIQLRTDADVYRFIEAYYNTSRERERTKAFYDSLRKVFAQRNLTAKLGNWLFNSPSAKKPTKFERSEQKFVPFEGKIIRDIHIRKLNIFEQNPEEIEKTLLKWIVAAGDAIHINTRNFVIRNNLIINRGDRIDPYKLADNERILRQLDFIRNADIEIIPDYLSDSVDIFIITRDFWSIGGTLKPHSLRRVDAEVLDMNMFGLGRKFINKVELDLTKDHPLTYMATYKVDNLGGAFLQGQLRYRNSYYEQFFEGSINRKPLLQNLKYHGGLHAGQYNLQQDFLIEGEKKPLHYSYRICDLWMGHNFISGPENRKSFLLSTGVKMHDFWNRSEYLRDFRNYQDRRLYLLKGLFAEVRYFTTTNVFGYGEIEDIPYGKMFSITAGYEDSGQENRHYLGLSSAYSKATKPGGLIRGELDVGGFINSKQIEDGVAGLNLLYLTPLINVGRYKFRQFLSSSATIGINRSPLDSIHINGDWGIRGFKSKYTYGKSKLAVNAESVFFTPWYFYGFKFALFGFLDMGIVGNSHDFSSSRTFSGIGLGLRIGNDNLAVRNIQLRFAFYPKAPDDEDFLQWIISGSRNEINTKELKIKPHTVRYE